MPDERVSSQMTYHRKPNGNGEPCDVCGCVCRKGTLHRALTAEEAWGHGGAAYVKQVRVAFGQDFDNRYLAWDGARHAGHNEGGDRGAGRA